MLQLGKMQAKIIGLVLITLIAGFGIMVYESTEKQAQDLYEAHYSRMDLLSSLLVERMKDAMHASEPEKVANILATTRSLKGFEQVRLYGKTGEELHGDPTYSAIPPDTQRKLSSALASGKAARFIGGNGLVLIKPLRNEGACPSCHNDGQTKVLGAVFVSMPVEDINHDIMRARVMGSLNASIVILFVLGIIAIFLRRMVLSNVEKAIAAISGMEKDRDLTARLRVKGNEEMSKFASSLNSFVETVQKFVQRINRVSYQVSSASTQIAVNSSRVADGAHVQAKASESTSGAIEEMNASIREVASAANRLSSSAEGTSSSIMQMTASIDEIAGSASVLSQSVDSTVSSLSEVSASIREVSSSVKVLSESVEVGAETLNMITSLVDKVEGSARESAQLTEKVARDARELGSGAMARAIGGMDRIKAAVERSGEVIDRLGARSKQIGEILDIIDEVTDQTELLSLNAAILASQAGEHGKGFAVVAGEIKDLAERTASSTSEISKLIASVQDEADEAVEAMAAGRRAVEEGQAVVHEAKAVLGEIVDSSEKSSEISKLIESSTTDQANGALLVREAMAKISDRVGHILKATQELTAGGDQIMREANKVMDVASQVKLSTQEQSKGSEVIIRAVEDVSVQARHIANATGEQSIGSQDIARSIERILEVARENEGLAGEMALAVEELARHTEDLKSEISSFRVATAGDEMVKLGIVPLDSPAQMYRKFSPLAAYISAQTGREVVFKLTPTFTDAVRDIGTGLADLCYMTPTTYIEAHDKYGVGLLAKAVRKGTPYSHTIIVAREDSPVSRLEDLKGKTFAFGDAMSTSSYMVPRYMLEKAGVKVEDLAECRFMGHHDDIAKAVLLGEVDAGGVREATALQYKGKGLKFLKVSQDIPEFNICMKPGMDAGLAEKIKRSLLSLKKGDPEKEEVIRSIDPDYTGFMDARDSDYAGIREMVTNMPADFNVSGFKPQK